MARDAPALEEDGLQAPGTTRLQFLESLRGLAALVVVLYHSALAFWPAMVVRDAAGLSSAPALAAWFARSPLSVVYDGHAAVVLFFVLSGFVLSHSFFHKPSHAQLSAAAVRRYFRLAVPVLASVLVSYALMRVHANRNVRAAELTGSEWLGIWQRFQPALLANSADGALRQGLYGAFVHMETSYNNVLWTMTIELPGSFLVYAFLALFGTARRRWIVYLAAVLLCGALGESFYFCDFFLGAALCDAHAWASARGHRWELGAAGWPLLALGLAVAGSRGAPPLPALIDPRWLALCPTIGGLLVIGAPLFSSSLRRALQSPPLAWLGKISFGLYLIHVLILCSAACALYVALRDRAGWTHGSASVAATAFEIAASLLGGWAMYRAADLPSIAAGRWVSRMLLDPSKLRAGPLRAAQES